MYIDTDAAEIVVYSCRRHKSGMSACGATIQPIRSPDSAYDLDRLPTTIVRGVTPNRLGDSHPSSSDPRYTSSTCSQAPAASHASAMHRTSPESSTAPVGLFGVVIETNRVPTPTASATPSTSRRQCASAANASSVTSQPMFNASP